MNHTLAPVCIYFPMKKMEFENQGNLTLGHNVKIEKNVTLEGTCVIGDHCVLKSGTVIRNCSIGNGSVIENSTLQESVIGQNCHIGPYSHLRPNCILEDNVKVGSFVEIKNSRIGSGSKLPHLSYVGDADIGKKVNIGCGVVFANYNGQIKQKSIVGDEVFIGCNVNIVAPVKIANRTYICAGTTVTKDTEEGDFVIGRVRQENKKR